jgi:VWFA-related protein
MKKAVSVLAGWLAVLVSVSAQQPAPTAQLPTFRTGVDAIQLDVSVLDKDRKPVRGLTAADFTVLEDGKPREVVAFSAVELPALPEAPSSKVATAPPDVTRNDLPMGRVVVILMDPFLERVMVPGRVTIADPPGITALRATAASVVNGLGPGDLAAVGHTMYGVPQNFTTDKNRLTRAIDTTAFGTNKRAAGEEWGNCNCGTCRLEAITRVANALRDESQRRKVIFFIGERIQLAPVPGQCNAYLEPATKQMLHATQLAHVNVHTVDPNAMETTNVHAGDDFQPESPGGVSGAARAQEAANRAFLIARHQSLQTVADWTGGRAILNTNAPEKGVRPILDESSAYYLLAFQTSDVKRDGRFHQVTVKVNRPDVQVRTRRGYYADRVAPAAPADTTAPLSLEALSRGLLPDRGLPMTVTTAPFRGPTGTPVVLVTTGVRAGDKAAATAPRQTETAPLLEPIEILTSAFRDGDKNVDWQRQRVSAALPPGTPGQLRYESVSTLTLQPGTYEVRVAARHEHENVAGSVYAYVDVPDFDRDPVALSGAVLLDRRAPTLPLPEALAGILDTAPTTRREFAAGDQVTALVRVYQRATQHPAAVNVFFQVVDEALKQVGAAEKLLETADFARTGAADARFPVPLETLRPGAYVMRIGVTEGDPALRRAVRFSVK